MRRITIYDIVYNSESNSLKVTYNNIYNTDFSRLQFQRQRPLNYLIFQFN